MLDLKMDRVKADTQLSDMRLLDVDRGNSCFQTKKCTVSSKDSSIQHTSYKEDLQGK